MRDVDRIAVLGAGSWGTALSTLLSRHGRVTLWTPEEDAAASICSTGENPRYLPGVRLPANTTATTDPAQALADAQVVVFVIPSAGMRTAVAGVRAYIPADALLVNASKGLEEGSGHRMSQVIAETITPTDPVRTLERLAVLSGPNLAVEVSRGVPTATVAAAGDDRVARAAQDLWMGATFRVYTSHDVIGVELAGAMKNVIAIGAGACEGMGYGDNSRAALMTRGLAEITRLGVALGAHPATFLGLAGVGDLIATGGSRLSRNYRVGLGLGQGKQLGDVLDEIGQVAEGVPTTRAICDLAREIGVDVPISSAIHEVLFGGVNATEAVAALMMRPPREESEF